MVILKEDEERGIRLNLGSQVACEEAASADPTRALRDFLGLQENDGAVALATVYMS